MSSLRSSSINRKGIVGLILIFLLLSSMNAHAIRKDDIASVTILADVSLTLPLTQIARNYSRERGVMVSVSYASAIEQLESVEDGTAANVLITAQPGSITQLKSQGLADVYSQTPIAHNRLALVARNDHPARFSFADGTEPMSEALEKHGKYFYFVTADPTFMELGAFSSEVIAHYNLDVDLQSHFVFPGDLPSMHMLIEEKPHAGLLYVSEAKRNNRLRIVDVVPEEAHSPVTYEAIVVAGEHMETARDFIAYMQSPPSQLTFTEMGFGAAK